MIWAIGYLAIGALLWVWEASDKPDRRQPILYVTSAIFWLPAMIYVAIHNGRE